MPVNLLNVSNYRKTADIKDSYCWKICCIINENYFNELSEELHNIQMISANDLDFEDTNAWDIVIDVKDGGATDRKIYVTVEVCNFFHFKT